MIIARYITKEITWAFLAAASILLFIALSNQFAMYLAKTATGELPLSLVFKMIGLYIPELLSLLIPLSLFVAILVVLGRLYADSEMTVLSTVGVGWGMIMRILLLLAIPITVLVGSYTLWFAPKLIEYREQSLAEAEALAVMQSLLPGRFQVLMDERMAFYLEDISSEDRTLKGVFIAEQPRAALGEKNYTLVTAKTAQLENNPAEGSNFLILKEGYRYQGQPGKADYTVVKFSEYGRNLEPQSKTISKDIIKLKSTKDLWYSNNLEDKGELQWRISVPLTIPILVLLALPLARVHPRQGRFAKFLPAILIYILYYNLITISKRWIMAGNFSNQIGVWWVHGALLLLALLLMAKEFGWWREWRGRKNRRRISL